jgi:protein phosphatase
VLRASALTNVGKQRDVNEDAFSLSDLATGWFAAAGTYQATLRSRGAVLGVYDGTGSAGPGRAASHLAARVVAQQLAVTSTDADLGRRLREALESAGGQIWASNRDPGARLGLGTTATVAAITSDGATIAHVGDSRAYLLARGGLRQVTRDDTLVNDLIDSGQLAPAQLQSFAHRNVITRCLGVTEMVELTLVSLSLEPGDLLLLCSDGVSAVLGDEAIAAILTAVPQPDPERVCRALIDAAEEAGGPDNQTAAVAVLEPG